MSNSGTSRSCLPLSGGPERAEALAEEETMLRQIVIEAETPGNSRTMFRLRIDANLIAEDLTTAQAHLLVGEILERIALPKPLLTLPSDDAEQPSSDSAALLGLGRAPCVRIEHLSEAEQRVLRLAANRLGEKGEWNLGELKIEFEELILTDAPIEVSGFTSMKSTRSSSARGTRSNRGRSRLRPARSRSRVLATRFSSVRTASSAAAQPTRASSAS